MSDGKIEKGAVGTSKIKQSSSKNMTFYYVDILFNDTLKENALKEKFVYFEFAGPTGENGTRISIGALRDHVYDFDYYYENCLEVE